MKRFVSFFIAVLLFTGVNIPPAMAEGEASSPGGDGAVAFSAPAIESYELDFDCASEALQLYFVWDEPPGDWTLTAVEASGGETEYNCGKYGFLHEYIRLDSPASKFRFSFSGDIPINGKVYAFGEGAVPDWVERWEPPCDKADLLVFPAKPGDEYLYFGGALPYYADKGKNIQVAYTTVNESMHRFISGLYRGGARNYPVVLRIEPENLYDGDALLDFYIEQLRRFKPEIALGQDEYANRGDDIREPVSAMLAVAIDIAGDEAEYPESAEKYGAWDVPKAYLHGLDSDAILMDWNAPLKKSGGKTAIEAAREAFVVQFPSAPQMSDVEFIALRGSDRFGLYRSAFGPDINGGDFFENTGQAVPSAAGGIAPIKPASAPPESEIPEEPDGRRETTNKNLDAGFPQILGVVAALCLVLALALRSRRER